MFIQSVRSEGSNGEMVGNWANLNCNILLVLMGVLRTPSFDGVEGVLNRLYTMLINTVQNLITFSIIFTNIYKFVLYTYVVTLFRYKIFKNFFLHGKL